MGAATQILLEYSSKITYQIEWNVNVCVSYAEKLCDLVQGFPNWGLRPLVGSRNNVQESQRVYQFYTKYCIYYSFCSKCTYYTAYTIVTIVYAVLCVKLI